MDVAKSLFFGMAAAAVAGLACGGALRYAGAPEREAAGPQLQVSGPSARQASPPWQEGAAVLTGHGERLPNYVLGTDWIEIAEAPALPPEPLPAEPAIRAAARQAWTAPTAPPEAFEQDRSVYPSVSGDILAGLGPHAPPPRHVGPPDALDEVNARLAAAADAAGRRIAARSS